MNEESNDQISSLQRQVFVLLIALILVSGTLTAYLYRQASIANNDLDAIRPQAQQIIGVFSQNKALMDSFVKQLEAYGEKHPDFLPILKKYGITPQPGVPAGTAPVAPKK